MELHDLQFARLIKLDHDLVEFIGTEGVEIDPAMVDQYHQWLRTHLSHPCLVLVNRVNRYSYTFEAQQLIGTIPEIKAIAFVTYSWVSELTTEALKAVPRSRPWNARSFHDRDAALRWLASQRDDTGG